ncbi:hypothetical protein NCS52_01023100 [Fusarium sp. LHS14.1]|nr:hypothetical protein NCS52_01023100 [Fusarium sp. LHS14.1]
MSEINNSPELTTTPSEVTATIPRSSIDVRWAEAERESRRAEADRKSGRAVEIERRGHRTVHLHRSNYHAFLQYVAPEETPTRKTCQSHGHCKAPEAYITSKYRVCLFGARPRYYHPECFEDRYDVPSLTPRLFKMEDPETCGLMAKKWFQHNRLVKLDVIFDYIMLDYLYEVGRLEPGQPKPDLKNYTTGEIDRCSLKDLVDNMSAAALARRLRLSQGNQTLRESQEIVQ